MAASLGVRALTGGVVESNGLNMIGDKTPTTAVNILRRSESFFISALESDNHKMLSLCVEEPCWFVFEIKKAT